MIALRKPLLLIAGAILATTTYAALSGRIWWCACGEWNLWSGDVLGPHNSQHLVDPYSFSHMLHGLIFFGALGWLFPRMSFAWRMAWSIAIECGWELLENSPWVIERYRAATAAQGYSGDSIINIWGDIGSCALGVWLASKLGLWWSLALFVATELIMLALIRDNLTLNVVMLIRPLPGLKTWQLGN